MDDQTFDQAISQENKNTKRVAIVFLVIGLLIIVTVIIFLFRYFRESSETQHNLATVDTGEPASSSQDIAPTTTPTPTGQSNLTMDDQISGFTSTTKPTPTAKPTTVPTPAPTAAVKGSTSEYGVTPSTIPVTTTKSVQVLGGEWVAINYNPGDITGSTHLVIYGDTLWEISEGKYGQGAQWKKIADLNNVGYLSNGNPLIIPNTTLKL